MDLITRKWKFETLSSQNFNPSKELNNSTQINKFNFNLFQDCWAELERDADGVMIPNKERFPSGIKALADYVCII